MSVPYEIHLQHAGRDTACAQLQTALEAELRSLGLHSDQVSILENAAVAGEAAEDPVSRVVAFLASDAEPPSEMTTRVEQYIEWIANGNRVRAVHGREARELAGRLKA